MLLQKKYCIKDIINELEQKHKKLMLFISGFSLYPATMYSTEIKNQESVNVETNIFRIDLFHHQMLSNGFSTLSELEDWSCIDKHKNISIMGFEQVNLVFITPENFDERLIPKQLLVFTKDWSYSNKFQIQHHSMKKYFEALNH